MTQAEIKKALEASVKDSYTAKTDDELRSQAEGMYKQQFENDLKALRKQTEQNVRAAYRDSLSAGMQRSSYVAAQQGLARSAGLESQQQLQSNYESNLANAIASLRDKDQEQKQAADQYRNQLLLQLYNMGRSGGTPSDDPVKVPQNPKYKKLPGDYNLLRELNVDTGKVYETLITAANAWRRKMRDTRNKYTYTNKGILLK